uniref:Uncharacterized protein n=1 Tax=Timema genevievae TaxID=629358 RepID=A0A7R9PMC7_TIMGE|nr:unnamed protein product [Timema genevievae]
MQLAQFFQVCSKPSPSRTSTMRYSLLLLLVTSIITFNVLKLLFLSWFPNLIVNLSLGLLTIVLADLLVKLAANVLPRKLLPDLENKAVFITGQYNTKFHLDIFTINRADIMVKLLSNTKLTKSNVDLKNKAVFITGCDSGFGNLCARRLDALGVRVYAGCLMPEGAGAKDLKNDTSSKLHIVPIDVTKEKDVDKAVEYVKSSQGNKGKRPPHGPHILRGGAPTIRTDGTDGDSVYSAALHPEDDAENSGQHLILIPSPGLSVEWRNGGGSFAGGTDEVSASWQQIMLRISCTFRSVLAVPTQWALTLTPWSSSSTYGSLWAVINNAGVVSIGETELMPVELFQRIIEVNTLGSVRVAKAFLPLIRTSKGRLVFTASCAGRFTVPGLVPYSMSKHAIVSFIDGLRREMRKWSVTVHGIEPMIYRTPMSITESHKIFLNQQWVTLPEETRQLYGDSYVDQYMDKINLALEIDCRSNFGEVIDDLIDATVGATPKQPPSVGEDIANICRYKRSCGHYDELSSQFSRPELLLFCFIQEASHLSSKAEFVSDTRLHRQSGTTGD